jgi:predicted acetyltransferase
MIIHSNETYKPHLMQMWKQCFPNDESFSQFYFDKIYRNEETWVVSENDMPVSSLQIIPHEIKMGRQIYKAGYLFGVMTHPDFRNKGYISHLLNFSFEMMKKEGYDYAFLIPQEESLFGFYERFGFSRFSPDSGSLTEKGKVIKSSSQLDNILEDFSNDNGLIFINDNKIAFTIKNDDTVNIKEIICSDEAGKNEMLKAIRQYYRLEKIVLPNENKGMIKKLNASAKDITTLYMGMMLD